MENIRKKKTFVNWTKKIWPNYKLHLLSLIKVQSSPLNFDRFNLVL